MDLLPCGHVAEKADLQACVHLVGDDPPDHFRLLRGVGVEYDLLCERCAEAGDPRSCLIEVCLGCALIDEEDQALGWRGEPEVRYRDASLTGSWSTRQIAGYPLNARCLAPLPGGWLAVTAEGLTDIPDGGDARVLGPIELAGEQPMSEWIERRRGPALHTSPDGRFAAVVNDYGRYGSVVDLSGGSTVLALDRGHYHTEQTPFPIAFLQVGRTTVMVAATAWNRLDAFDPATGKLLTARNTNWTRGTNWPIGEPWPDHFLGYFHGALRPNPGGGRLLDDGWVWSPVGCPMLINAADWLAGDTYASEHGHMIAARSYAWDQPVAWIDDDTVAIQRIGVDDEAMIDGVEVYDAPSGRRTATFAGPAGPMWAHEGRLYVSAAGGLEVWDPADGARTGVVNDFRPTAHNPVSGTFAEATGNELRTWTPST